MKLNALVVLLALASSCEKYHDSPVETTKAPPAPPPARDDVDDELDPGTDDGTKDDDTQDPPEDPKPDPDTEPDTEIGQPEIPKPEPETPKDPAKDPAEDPKPDPEPKKDPPVDPVPEPKPREFSVEGMLQNLGHNITFAQTTHFVSALQSLDSQVQSFCKADPNDSTALESLRVQWLNALMSWQTLDAAQFGPLAENNAALRNLIYSWDLSSQPRFALKEAARSLEPNFVLSDRSIEKGLDAIEATIFDPELADECRSFATIPAQWSRLSEAQQHQARCKYLAALVADLYSNGSLLREAWHPEGGNHTQKQMAGKSQEELHKAVNHITDGLFYIETRVKDQKIGIPTGIKASQCKGASCACFVENRYAKVSLDSIAQNIKSFESYVTGDPLVKIKSQNPDVLSLGLADYLENKGHGDLANQLVLKIKVVLKKIADLDGSSLYQLALDQHAEPCTKDSEDSPLCELHGDLKAVTDLFKDNVMEALKLERPKGSSGDGD